MFLLVLMVALKPCVLAVPVIALVAIMVMVPGSTFDWKFLGNLLHHPRLSSAVMLVTVVITIATTIWPPVSLLARVEVYFTSKSPICCRCGLRMWMTPLVC